MNYTEEIALFSCDGDTLLGILAKPESPAETGVIVIVGGPQYRVGSHRQFVLLSRALATASYAVLRFDYRGMGDSTGAPHDFESVGVDIAAAIDTLQARLPNIKQVSLWGLCDGASAALLYCHATQDRRVQGLCLLNPWVRSEASLARTQVKHYYTQRLRQKEFWIKLFNGEVAVSAISGFIKNIKAGFSRQKKQASKIDRLPFQRRMAVAWGQFDGSVLLVLSGNDYTAKEFLEYAGADAAWSAKLAHPGISRHELPAADHTFSDLASRIDVEELTVKWLDNLVLQSNQLSDTSNWTDPENPP